MSEEVRDALSGQEWVQFYRDKTGRRGDALGRHYDTKQESFVGAADLLRHRGGEADILETAIDMEGIEHVMESVSDSLHGNTPRPEHRYLLASAEKKEKNTLLFGTMIFYNLLLRFANENFHKAVT